MLPVQTDERHTVRPVACEESIIQQSSGSAGLARKCSQAIALSTKQRDLSVACLPSPDGLDSEDAPSLCS